MARNSYQFPPIPDVQKSRNSALHFFKLCKWSSGHPWDVCYSGIGRNDQEFLPIPTNSHQFPPIPDVQKCRNSALHFFNLCKWSFDHPWDVCNSGIGRNDQEFLPIPTDSQWFPICTKCRNSALHLFNLCKWSSGHPWDVCNSRIGRNDQEFLQFLLIPSDSRCAENAGNRLCISSSSVSDHLAINEIFVIPE